MSRKSIGALEVVRHFRRARVARKNLRASPATSRRSRGASTLSKLGAGSAIRWRFRANATGNDPDGRQRLIRLAVPVSGCLVRTHPFEPACSPATRSGAGDDDARRYDRRDRHLALGRVEEAGRTAFEVDRISSARPFRYVQNDGSGIDSKAGIDDLRSTR